VFYVRQNPWSKFDPLGLSEEELGQRSSGHHKVIYSRIEEEVKSGNWSHDVGRLLNGQSIEVSGKTVSLDNALIATPDGHDFSGHGQYNNRLNSLVSEFSQRTKLTGTGTGEDAVKYAQALLSEVEQTSDGYIRGFNAGVSAGKGPVDMKAFGDHYKAGVFSGDIDDNWYGKDGTATGRGGAKISVGGGFMTWARRTMAGLGIFGTAQNVKAHGPAGGIARTVLETNPVGEALSTTYEVVKAGAGAVDTEIDQVIHPRGGGPATKSYPYNMMRSMMDEYNANDN
jgi:hypothetical protein